MFELNHVAEIRAINVAKGKGDEAPVCVTISFDFETVGTAPVAAALGCVEADLHKLFTDQGESRFTGITEIHSWAEFEDRHTIKMLGFTCDVAKVSKIRVAPTGKGNFSLSCSVQIQDPPVHVIEQIATSLHSSKQVSLDGEPELPLEAVA